MDLFKKCEFGAKPSSIIGPAPLYASINRQFNIVNESALDWFFQWGVGIPFCPTRECKGAAIFLEQLFKNSLAK